MSISLSIAGVGNNIPDLDPSPDPAPTATKPTFPQQLHSLVTSGHSVEQIATALGISAEQVNTALGITSVTTTAALASTRLSITA